MTRAMQYLISQFDLQTRLFNNVTAGISDGNAVKPMNQNTNHIAWLTGHSVSTRYLLANALGIRAQEPFPGLFGNSKGMDKSAAYPSMKELTKDWNSISESLRSALDGIGDEALGTKTQPSPTGDTVGDFIAFIIHHEAYTLGQLGIYRRFHGMEAMKYG